MSGTPTLIGFQSDDGFWPLADWLVSVAGGAKQTLVR